MSTSKDFEAFLQAKSVMEASDFLRDGLVCKVGDNPTLKLLKSSWTNDSHDYIDNESGIFFSVWKGSRQAEQNIVLYNIHALKLRTLKGYRLESRRFASAFREEFITVRQEWPNVSTDFGPQTLMQGWIPRKPETLLQDILGLADSFRTLVPVIDRLLDPARRD